MNSQQNPDLAVHPLAIPIEGLLGESNITLEKNVIATQLSEEAQLKLEVIQSLLEPCDRICGRSRCPKVSPDVTTCWSGNAA